MFSTALVICSWFISGFLGAYAFIKAMGLSYGKWKPLSMGELIACTFFAFLGYIGLLVGLGCLVITVAMDDYGWFSKPIKRRN